MSTPFDLGYQNPVATVQINTGFVGAAQAQAAAIAAAADRVQTGADRAQTGLDRVATGNDAASTAADRVQTQLDRIATGTNASSTAADRTAVAADRAQADGDAAATAADRVQTSADRVTTTNNAAATAADRTQTGLDASATAADRVQTALDVVQTGADRIQTGQDVVTSNTNAALAASNSLTATAQAALAATYASSASSVVQQDLSAIAGQALHRSPNAIVAQAIYDTSRDSDGGAWVDRLANTSWFNEALSGTWLGQQPDELNARASGALLGPNLIASAADSTFAADTGYWTKSGNTVIAGGVCTISPAASNNMGISKSGVLTVGKLYRVSFDVKRITAGDVRFSSGAIVCAANGTTGTKSLVFLASNADIKVLSSTAATDVDIDNVAVSEVTAFTTASGAYYQDSTTGKHQRLWKNILKSPQDFSQSWSATPGTVVSGAVGSQVVTPTAGTAGYAGISINSASVVPTIGCPATVTVEVGNTGSRYVVLSLDNNAGLFTQAMFDLQTLSASVAGHPGDASGTSASITPSTTAGRYWLTWKLTIANTLTYFHICPSSSAPPVSGYGWNITNDGVTGLSIFNSQIEYGSTFTGFETKASTDGYGTTEIFRGNTAKFPRLAAVVAEATSVTIYDLTQPGRPMWMRFIRGSNASLTTHIGSSAGPVSCIEVRQGQLVLGTNLGLSIIDFPADAAHYKNLTTATRRLTNIAQRNVEQTSNGTPEAGGLASSSINAIAMAVLPDAPLDPFTGLQVPTIAVGTGAGLSVIKHDGSVVNSSSSSAFTGVQITPEAVFGIVAGTTASYALKPSSLAASFTMSTIASNTAPGFSSAFNWNGISMPNRATIFRRSSGGVARLEALKFNESSPAASLLASITDTYNTGWTVGDIRRCWLSSNVAESLTATELVTNGTFSTDASGWSPNNAGAAVWDSSAQMKVVTLSGGSWNFAYQSIPTVVGKTYRLSGTVIAGTATNYRLLAGTVAQGGTYTSIVTTPGAVTGPAFVATTTTTIITCQVSDGVVGSTVFFDNISLQEVIADRSYKNKPLTINGTLTKSLTGGLAMYSGWNASSYAQEPYSSDLDFGTGGWSVSAWANVPVPLPTNPANFANASTELSSLAGASGFNSTVTTSGGSKVATSTVNGSYGVMMPPASPGLTTGKYYRLTVAWSANAAGRTIGVDFGGGSKQMGNAAAGTLTFYMKCTNQAANSIPVYSIGGLVGESFQVDALSIMEVTPAWMVDRSAPSGSFVRLGLNPDGTLVAIANDGTTTRSVISPAAYNTATNVKVRVEYATSGTLTLKINGQPVASATGTPLLTLSNASAVTTIGNARTLDAAFPGSIALVKVGATTPTQEQSTFMYEQEKFLFMPNAICTLPDSGAVLDMDYDSVQDRLKVVSAANESAWTGLVCTSTSPVSAGSFTKASHRSGVKLLARSTTNPGVDVTIPAYGLREELVNRAERAASLSRSTQAFDWVGGFTANMTGGSVFLSSITGLVSPPVGSTYSRAVFTGVGIAAGSFVPDTIGATAFMSAAATTGGTGVAIAFTDFILPVGYEAVDVYVNRSLQQEGATKDFTRLYDGFRETIRFAVAPGSTAWVRIDARRKA
jgi:hypothetical protein